MSVQNKTISRFPPTFVLRLTPLLAEKLEDVFRRSTHGDFSSRNDMLQKLLLMATASFEETLERRERERESQRAGAESPTDRVETL